MTHLTPILLACQRIWPCGGTKMVGSDNKNIFFPLVRHVYHDESHGSESRSYP